MEQELEDPPRKPKHDPVQLTARRAWQDKGG
jgi:hypothetical protein